METEDKNYKKDEDERVKTFLKIKTCETVDKQYYAISDNKQILSLFDPIVKSETSKTIKFEIDKIFTDKNENSYIYEEIARDCVSDSLKGEDFTFISYGDSLSDKNSIIFGEKDCYKNLNSRGVFPRILDSLLTTVTSNKSMNDNIIINLSYICVYGNKLIDLSKFTGKDLFSINQNEFVNNGIEIKTSPDIINKVKKVQVDNSNEVIFFISKIFDLLYKLEVESMHLLSWSHFSFLIYINDNSGKTISTLSFIILAGSDLLSTKVKNPKTTNKSTISNTKNVVEVQYTFDNIVKNINAHAVINELEQSRLATVLLRSTFSNKMKRKFRVIGSIVPNTGMYNTVKDTLMFLFECKKTVRIRPTIKEDLGGIKPAEMKRDDIIYDLESKLKAQGTKIKELNERLDYKQKKIEILTENYKKQIEVMKKEFNFTGDVNVLLSGNEYTKESKYARSVRDAMDNCRIKGNRIQELEEKINLLKEEIKKIKYEQDLKNTDQTMANIYIKLKEDKLAEEKKLTLNNEHSSQMEELKKKNQILQQIIEEYKKEIENKTKLIHNLPNSLKDNKDQFDKIQKIKEDTKKRVKEHFKKEIAEIESNNVKENKKLVDKYENLIQQKKDEIKTISQQYSELKNNYDRDINSYVDELIRLKDTIDNVISNYKKSFDLKKFDSNMNSLNNFNMFLNFKREYDKNLVTIEESMSPYQYPLLFKYLSLKGPTRTKTKIVAIEKIKKKPQEKEVITIQKPKEITTEMIEQKHEKIFSQIKPNDEIEKLNQGELLDYCKSIHKIIQQIEDYANNYIKYKKGYNVKEFEINEKYVNELYNKKEKLQRILEEQVSINNKNKIIISSHERMIEKLNSENFLLRNTLNSRMLNNKITYPYFADEKRSKRDNDGAFRHTFSQKFHSPPNINNISVHKKGSVLTKPQTTIQSTHPTSTKHYNPCITTNNIGCYQITN